MSYYGNYVFNTEGLAEAAQTNEEIKTLLSDSYSKSLAFFQSMIDTPLWKGHNKDEFMAFYHLVLQYHGWVAGKNTPTVGDLGTSINVEINSSEELCKAFTDLLSDMEAFCGSSEKYADLETVV